MTIRFKEKSESLYFKVDSANIVEIHMNIKVVIYISQVNILKKRKYTIINTNQFEISNLSNNLLNKI